MKDKWKKGNEYESPFKRAILMFILKAMNLIYPFRFRGVNIYIWEFCESCAWMNINQVEEGRRWRKYEYLSLLRFRIWKNGKKIPIRKKYVYFRDSHFFKSRNFIHRVGHMTHSEDKLLSHNRKTFERSSTNENLVPACSTNYWPSQRIFQIDHNEKGRNIWFWSFAYSFPMREFFIGIG